MSMQTIKDAHFRVIGYIETRSDGTQVGKDSHFRVVGYYDPKRNQTKDAQFQLVGHANLLASLITGRCG